VAIPKKAIGEYRGISLLCSAYKVYSKLLLSRVMDSVVEIAGTSQNGFLPGRSTADVIGCMRRMLESSGFYRSSLHGRLVDFSKAFDKVSRKAIFSVLIDRGVDMSLVTRIEDLLTGTTSSVRCGSRESRKVQIRHGVRQGCPISPSLFVVVLSFVLGCVDSGIGCERLFHLEYADDLTLVSECKEIVEEAFAMVEELGKPCGLFINRDKTEDFAVEGGTLDHDFKLLGTIMGDWRSAVEKRVAAARGSFCSLYKRLWKENVSLRVKVRVFRSVCISRLLYGLESLPLTPARSKKLDSFAYRSLRSLVGLRYDDHVTYQELHDIVLVSTGIDFVWPSKALREARVRDFWHFARHHNFYNQWRPEGGRPRPGRPKTRLVDVVAKDMALPTKTVREMLADASNFPGVR